MPTRVRKIKMRPTPIQKRILKKWIGTSRYVYNNCLSGIRRGEYNINFMSLRDEFVTYKRNGSTSKDYSLYDMFYKYKVKDWELETPKEIRANAVKDLVNAFKTCFSKLKNKQILKFNVSYRKKKKPSSIVIQKQSINLRDKKVRIYPEYMKSGIRLVNDKCLKNLKITKDCRIKYVRGEYYLMVPVKKKITNRNPTYRTSCGIDPGIRKFATVYSNEEMFYIKTRKDKLRKLYLKIDNLNRIRSKEKISYSKYKRHINRYYNKLDNRIDDMQNTLISILTSKYSKIHLPKFESQDIGRKLRNSRRNLFQLKHYKFKTKLIDKCSLYSDVDLNICTEEYTTKTCTRC
ncbi:MAG: transposase, partial [Nitrososphaeraceae archaeon]|nr:transposase [Nitrososphaeraceae archaeon]